MYMYIVFKCTLYLKCSLNTVVRKKNSITQSFRFGPEIAYKAFFPLQDLSCKHVMIGNMRRGTCMDLEMFIIHVLFGE